MGKNDFIDITVYNRSKVPISRGRHIFPARSTVVVRVKQGSQFAEINACTDLRVREGNHLPVEQTEQAPLTLQTATGAAAYDEMDTPTLLSLAHERQAYIPAGAHRDVIIAALSAADGVDPRRTIYTGLTGPVDTEYTGVQSDDANEERNVSGIMYEERSVPELVEMMKARGLPVPQAATHDELIDALKQADGDPGSNVTRRADDSDEVLDPMNVAQEAGMVTLPDDVPPAPAEIPATAPNEDPARDAGAGVEEHLPEESEKPKPQTDWSKLGVEALRAALADRAISVPDGAKKADLVALLKSADQGNQDD